MLKFVHTALSIMHKTSTPAILFAKERNFIQTLTSDTQDTHISHILGTHFKYLDTGEHGFHHDSWSKGNHKVKSLFPNTYLWCDPRTWILWNWPLWKVLELAVYMHKKVFSLVPIILSDVICYLLSLLLLPPSSRSFPSPLDPLSLSAHTLCSFPFIPCSPSFAFAFLLLSNCADQSTNWGLILSRALHPPSA